jgi:hypothetical protein
LILDYHELLSNVAFNFNLRRSTVALTAVLCARTAHVYHFHRRRMLKP